MRKEIKNKDFNYVLLCNKICGVSHSNMFLPVIVGTQDEFDAWRADGVSTSFVVPREEPEAEVADNLEESAGGEEGNGEAPQN